MKFEFLLKGNHTMPIATGESKKLTKGTVIETEDPQEIAWYSQKEDVFGRRLFRVIREAVVAPKTLTPQQDRNMQEAFKESQEAAIKNREESEAKVIATIEENRAKVAANKPAKGYEPEPTTDEFGPLKGTPEYAKLKQGEKIKLGQLRKQKEIDEEEKGIVKPPPVEGPTLADLDDDE